MKYVASGFTLIELLVVFSIVIILSTGSLVAYNSYNQSQKLILAAKQFATVLQKAKFQTQNQISPTLTAPDTCTKLLAYEIRICSRTTCVSTGKDYELDAVCSNATYAADSYALDPDVALDSLRTNTATIRFQLLTGGVTGAGNVYFQLSADATKEKYVTINQQGIIQIN